MMTAYSNLTLLSPQKLEEPASDLPTGLTPTVERAGLYINHAAVIGDLLSFDIAPLIDVYNEIYNRDDDKDVLIHEEQISTFIQGLSEIQTRLRQAIDAEGKPKPNEDGQLLSSSSLIETDSLNRLYLTSHHVLLIDLLDKLDMMLAMFNYAHASRRPIALV